MGQYLAGIGSPRHPNINGTARTSTMFPRPAAQSVHFEGVIDDVKSLKREADKKLEAETEARVITALSEPVLTVYEKKLTGFELLMLVEELSKKDQWSAKHNFEKFFVTALGVVPLGIPLLFSKFRQYLKTNWTGGARHEKIRELLYGDKNARNWEAQDALKKLEKLGVVKRYVSEDPPTMSEMWRLTDLGRKALSKATLGGHSVQKAVPNSDLRTKNASSEQLRLEQIKIILASNRDGQTGWDVMKTIDKFHKEKGGLARFLSPGILQKELTLQLATNDKESLMTQLYTLKSMGLLESREGGTPEKTRWTLTDEAKNLLQKEDPMQACHVTHDDMNTLLKMEIEDLEAEKRQRKQQVQILEGEFNKAFQSLQRLERQWEQDKENTVETFEKAKAVTEPMEKTRLEDQVTEMVQQTDHLRKKIALEADWLGQLKAQLTRAKAFHTQWTAQANQSIEKLTQAQIKVRTIETNRQIATLMKEIQSIEELQQKQNESLNALFTSLLGNIEGEFFHSQAVIEDDIASPTYQANESIQKTSLAMQVEAMQKAQNPVTHPPAPTPPPTPAVPEAKKEPENTKTEDAGTSPLAELHASEKGKDQKLTAKVDDKK